MYNRREMTKTSKVMYFLMLKDLCEKTPEFYQILAKMIMNELFGLMGDEWEIGRVREEKPHVMSVLNDLSFLLTADLIESRHAKNILSAAWDSDEWGWDIFWYLSDSNLLEEAEGDELSEIIAKVVEAHQEAKEDILNGKKKAIGFLLGKVMQEAKGKANPNQVREGIENYIN